MQVVIDLPEETYRDVVKNGFIYDEDNEVISHSIINGTPLPKGHGDIIDRNGIEYMKAIHDMKWGKITAKECATKIRNSAPTIIEADAKSEENK